MFESEGGDQRLDSGGGVDVQSLEDGGVLKCVGDSLVVQAWAVDAQGRGMLVFTVEDGPVKSGLELCNGRFCNMMGEMLAVFTPQVVAKFSDIGGWYRR